MLPSAWLFDFDRTVANTFVPSPGAIGVNEAMQITIRALLGPDALARYRSSGGLSNRSHTELTLDLCPGLDAREAIELTNRMVAFKLDLLIPEIGQSLSSGEGVWPPPCPGFIPFWQAVAPLMSGGRLLTGIVSSGHERFIRRTFEVWGLTLPHVLVTDDDMRGLTDVAVCRRSKPDPLILEIACQRLGLSSLSGVTYFGDDDGKDGGLARNAGVPFGHFDETAIAFERFPGGFRFPDWRLVIDRLPR